MYNFARKAAVAAVFAGVGAHAGSAGQQVTLQCEFAVSIAQGIHNEVCREKCKEIVDEESESLFYEKCTLEIYAEEWGNVVTKGECFHQWAYGFTDDQDSAEQGLAGEWVGQVATAGDCQDECQKSESCVLFMWRESDGNCVLKDERRVNGALNQEIVGGYFPLIPPGLDVTVCNQNLDYSCYHQYDCLKCGEPESVRCAYWSAKHVAGPRKCAPDFATPCEEHKLPVATPTEPVVPTEVPSKTDIVDPIVHTEDLEKTVTVDPIVHTEDLEKTVTVDPIVPTEDLEKTVTVDPIVHTEDLQKTVTVDPIVPTEDLEKTVTVDPIVHTTTSTPKPTTTTDRWGVPPEVQPPVTDPITESASSTSTAPPAGGGINTPVVIGAAVGGVAAVGAVGAAVAMAAPSAMGGSSAAGAVNAAEVSAPDVVGDLEQNVPIQMSFFE